jgi:PadR family transcriptional regulator, regulatory protein PadR
MPRHRRGWAVGGSPHQEERHSPLMAAVLEPTLLLLLQEQSRHGYTLLADLEELGMTIIHPSVVYRMLREMEALDWITSDWDADRTQGPPRRMYQLTAQGERILENWRLEMKRTRDFIDNLLDRIELSKRSE